MDIISLRAYCLSRAGLVTEESPFGEGVMVYKVEGKMFALIPLDAHPPEMNLKCDPVIALELRDRYDAVQPGYHMSKKHWNTVICDGSIPTRELEAMIDASHALVVGGLPKSIRSRML